MLKLTKKVDYGILAMSKMAAEPASLVSAREVAEEFELSHRLMANILKTLARGELIRSERGSSGGYTLNDDPSRVTLGDLVRTLEGPLSIAECTGHHGEEMLCSLMGSCPAMSVIQQVHRRIEHVLDDVTCADLADAYRTGRLGLESEAATASAIVHVEPEVNWS